jgi:Protein kinase domain
MASTPDPEKTARIESDARFTPRYASLEPQFAPGSIVAGRYRIAGILGKGGMGEVYRADDIKLGQAVALKFLPARLARDPILLARLHDEVRLGRQISHPNVCRTYDIAEWDGAHFVAMEYVDGEDLGRLLHRIGRISHDKAVDIARGIAAGLMAAHAKGILHRDLKPANVMVDSHGDARITDFGLALSATDDQEGDIAGTPAYMAPEQLQGAPATVQSDLYALGLVMYELFTGRRAHAAKTFPDRIRDITSEITQPSNHIRDIDPAVERIILRCLASDPAQRPRSAREVIEALPGGDPLAAAMAAGETPSPRIVAAAGAEGSLRPAMGWALLAMIAIELAVVFWAFRHDGVFSLQNPKSPDVLEDRASAIRDTLGLPSQPFRTAGWTTDFSVIGWISKNDFSRRRWEGLRHGLPATPFYIRHEPEPVRPRGTRAVRPTPDEPPLLAPGASVLQLDARGRLVALEAVPSARWQTRALDWSEVFAAAGLDPARFTPANPTALPHTFADVRAAWTGKHPDDGTPVRIEAAAFRGVPVAFRLLGPWYEDPSKTEEVPFEGGAFPIVISVMVSTAIAVGVVLAWRNLRLRRGDRQGAIRVGAVLAILNVAMVILLADHELSVSHERGIFVQALTRALLYAAGFCLVYIALEPYLRRRWPDRLISWARLLAGNWRDPMVGRDVLIGVAGGVAHSAVAAGLGTVTRLSPLTTDNEVLTSPLAPFGYLAYGIHSGIVFGMTYMIVLMILTIVLRRRALAAVGIGVLMFGVYLSASRDVTMLAGFAMLSILVAVMTARFGLLATATFHATFALTFFSPIPAAISWYTAAGLVAPVFVVLAAIWAFRTSLGGQSPWHSALLDE